MLRVAMDDGEGMLVFKNCLPDQIDISDVLRVRADILAWGGNFAVNSECQGIPDSISRQIRLYFWGRHGASAAG